MVQPCKSYIDWLLFQKNAEENKLSNSGESLNSTISLARSGHDWSKIVLSQTTSGKYSSDIIRNCGLVPFVTTAVSRRNRVNVTQGNIKF